jgi:chemotaxis regulatin CheY-phosphate phosphatase CheZ
MTIVTALRIEAAARRQTETRLQQAQERAQQAAAKARQCLRLTVQMAATAVNEELDHVPNAQAVARACLLAQDIENSCATIEQYLDDLLFQPLQLLARETEDC